MALNDYETSRDRGQPVLIYEFVYGVEIDGITPIALRYTDGETDVVYDSQTYTPLPIKTGKIESSGKMETPEVSIDVPRDSQLAELFRIYPPSRVVTVVIRQGHIPNADDPPAWATGDNFPIVWLGRVLESSRDGPDARLTCEATSASMKRSGLRRHYQWPCPLVLYGPRCAADRLAASTTSTVATISGNRLTLNTPWQKQVEDPPPDPLPDPYTPTFSDIGGANYTGGLVEWTGSEGPEQRAIMRVTDLDEIILNGPAFDLDVGDTVTVLLGCPHTLQGCEALHNNVVNYGGHPYIPTHNPLGKNNHT